MAVGSEVDRQPVAWPETAHRVRDFLSYGVEFAQLIGGCGGGDHETDFDELCAVDLGDVRVVLDETVACRNIGGDLTDLCIKVRWGDLKD